MRLPLENPLRKLPANRHGQDYVIGDLHGCYDLLEKLLLQVAFNPHVDRLFSVGDLVDRGAYAFDCLKLLDQPWFHAVRGNHEQLMLDFFETYLATGFIDKSAFNSLKDTSYFLVNGGEWVDAFFHPQTNTMKKSFETRLKQVQQLPYILIVGEGEQRFHVVHADLLRPKDASGVLSLWTDNDLDEWHTLSAIPQDCKRGLLWSRSLMGSGSSVIDATPYPGLSITYCGHTIDKYDGELRQRLSHCCLDHGAYQSENRSQYGLMMINANTQAVHIASYLPI